MIYIIIPKILIISFNENKHNLIELNIQPKINFLVYIYTFSAFITI